MSRHRFRRLALAAASTAAAFALLFLARRILEEGHELGNHSYSHPRMLLMSQRGIRDEVETTDALIRVAGAQDRIHFRPPYGKRLVPSRAEERAALPMIVEGLKRQGYAFVTVSELMARSTGIVRARPWSR